MKKYSVSTVIEEMQIKTTKKYLYTPIRTAKTERLITSGSGKGMEQSELSHVLCNANVWFKIIPSLWKKFWQFLLKLYIYLTDQFNWVASSRETENTCSQRGACRKRLSTMEHCLAVKSNKLLIN